METSRIDNKTPRRAVHPSEIIKDELEARGISRKEFSGRMGMKASNVSRLLRGDNDITVQVAEKLEEALGIPASHWTGMQHEYNKSAREIAQRDKYELAAVEIERRLSEIFNLRELYKRLGIGNYMYVQKKLGKLGDLLHVEPAGIMSMMPTIFGACKSTNHHVDEKNFRTWIILAYAASMRNTPEQGYREGNAFAASRGISALANAGDITEAGIKDVLNGNGIAYSVVGKLDGVPVDGFSTLACGHPAIVTTHRYDDMIRLIFTVLHELGHIHLHFRDNEKCSFVSFGDSISPDETMEVEANGFAEKALIDDEAWRDIMNTSSRGLYTKDIVSSLKRKAMEHHLNFPIVLWRYRYETKMYNISGIKTNPIV